MDPNQANQPTPAPPDRPPSGAPGATGTSTPILTKAVASVILGVLSLPSCFCFAFPSLLLGGAAIWLGVWVLKNYRGNTASELANLWAWMGIITGTIGMILGLVGSILLLTGVGAGLVGAASSP